MPPAAMGDEETRIASPWIHCGVTSVRRIPMTSTRPSRRIVAPSASAGHHPAMTGPTPMSKSGPTISVESTLPVT
jgi:hypothetical protein